MDAEDEQFYDYVIMEFANSDDVHLLCTTNGAGYTYTLSELQWHISVAEEVGKCPIVFTWSPNLRLYIAFNHKTGKTLYIYPDPFDAGYLCFDN
jgi:hypothetical protein